MGEGFTGIPVPHRKIVFFCTCKKSDQRYTKGAPKVPKRFSKSVFKEMCNA